MDRMDRWEQLRHGFACRPPLFRLIPPSFLSGPIFDWSVDLHPCTLSNAPAWVVRCGTCIPPRSLVGKFFGLRSPLVSLLPAFKDRCGHAASRPSTLFERQLIATCRHCHVSAMTLWHSKHSQGLLAYVGNLLEETGTSTHPF